MISAQRAAVAAAAGRRHMSSSSSIVQPPPPQPWKALHAIFPVVVPTTENFFPDIPSSSEGVAVKQVPALQTSKLANGVVVASQDHHGHASSVGVFVRAGTSHVPRASSSLPLIVANSAFKMTTARSHFLTSRRFEEIGINPNVQATRDQISYTFESLRTNAGEGLALVAESLFPRITDHALHEIAQTVKDNLKPHRESSASIITDGIHTAAFSGGLSNPTVVTDASIDDVTTDAIEGFLHTHFVGSNVVVAAHGVDHGSFVQSAQQSALNAVPSGSCTHAESKYVGGDVTLTTETTDGLAHVAIAFEGPSWSHPSLATYAVLQTLLGGGDSFSAGGPGKGMLSRLYRNVLMSHGWVESAIAFCHAYDHAGVFGVQGSCHASRFDDLTQHLAKEVASLKSGSISAEELERAKNQTAMSMLINLERRTAIVDDIGRQLQTFGKYRNSAEVLKLVEAVSAKDITSLLSSITAKPISFISLSPESTSEARARALRTLK